MLPACRAVDLEGPSVYQGAGAQSLKLGAKAAVFKRVTIYVDLEAEHVDWGGGKYSLGAGPACEHLQNVWITLRLIAGF